MTTERVKNTGAGSIPGTSISDGIVAGQIKSNVYAIDTWVNINGGSPIHRVTSSGARTFYIGSTVNKRNIGREALEFKGGKRK